MTAFYSFFFLVGLLVQYILNKVYVYYDAEDMNDTNVYKKYTWISWILIAPLLAAFWFLDLNEPQPLLALLMTIPCFYRGYMEFTYIHESRRHIVSFVSAFYFLAFAILLEIVRLLI